ncbi:MAG: DUF2927 domain-containing protein, partial [Silicimonas sp.]|nr:DUF2927 domain-containing protein [Silicimonas sp.]
PITRTSGTGTASIVIEPVTRAQIQRVAPSAACFVRPNVSSWKEYRARKNDRDTYWNRLTKRTRMTVFLPHDVAPQEIRDCLHEEIAQALGPVNDLYRLSQSVFNDDNFHTVLTGYDMLILRTYYEGTLRTGMSEFQVAERLPDILLRLNPAGGRQGIAPPVPPRKAWVSTVNDATALSAPKARRRAAADRSVALAQQAGLTDIRLGLSFYLKGRVSLTHDPDKALAAFLTAGRIYQNRPDTAIHEAHVALQIAAFQLAAGRSDVAIALVDAHLDVVREAEHAALLSLLLMVKAEAFELQGRPGDAARIQRDALAWARYGFGDEKKIRKRAEEILAISPRSRDGGAA